MIQRAEARNARRNAAEASATSPGVQSPDRVLGPPGVVVVVVVVVGAGVGAEVGAGEGTQALSPSSA